METIWRSICFYALTSYFGINFILGRYLKPRSYTMNSGHEFHLLYMLSIAAYSTSMLRSICCIFVVNAPQRPALYCAIVIAAIACHAHYLEAIGDTPIVASCFGHPLRLSRFSEWISTGPFLASISQTLETDSTRISLRRTFYFQLVCVIIGSILLCDFGNTWLASCQDFGRITLNQGTLIVIKVVMLIVLLVGPLALHIIYFNRLERSSQLTNESFLHLWS